MKFRIYRYNPDVDTAPYMQDYELDIRLEDSAQGKMLLDALLMIKQQDDSLSLRKSCREGVCGSDAMNINGRNGLACITPLSGLKEPVELRPLPGLPVIRDLIVDMTQFFRQYHSIKPYLIKNDPPPETVRLLYHFLSVVLVEPGQVRRPGRIAAGLSFHRRHARSGHQRAPRRSRGSVSFVPLSHHHELRGCVSERVEPDRGHRKNQGYDGEAHRMSRRLLKPEFRRHTVLRSKNLAYIYFICGAAIFQTRLVWLRNSNF